MAQTLVNGMTKPLRQTKASVERRVRTALRPHLSPYLRLVQRTDRLIHNVVQAHNNVPNNSKALRAKTILLARVGNDARAMGILARSGYVMQSWAMGTSILEHCFSVGHIGTDEARATEWFEHKNIKRTPWDTRRALRSTLARLELSEFEDSFYRHYTNLSAAKHGNPTLQSGFGVRNDSTVTRIQLDLFFSPGIARAARAGLCWAMHGIGLALWSFTNDQPLEQRRLDQVQRFAADTHRLLEGFRDVKI